MIYIVYAYVIGPCPPTQYIMGTYTNVDDAIARQYKLCGKRAHLYDGNISNKKIMTWVLQYPEGDCKIELHTNKVIPSNSQ